MNYDNPKVDALLEATNGWSESDFLALAMAALDQAGVRSWAQLRVIDLLWVVSFRRVEEASRV